MAIIKIRNGCTVLYLLEFYYVHSRNWIEIVFFSSRFFVFSSFLTKHQLTIVVNGVSLAFVLTRILKLE